MRRLSFLCCALSLFILSACVADKPADEDRRNAGDRPSGITGAGMAGDNAVLIDESQSESAGESASSGGERTSEEAEEADDAESVSGDECTADEDCPLAMVQTCVDGRCLDRCGMGIGCVRGGECIDGVCIKECDESDDCEAGQRCDENKCVTPTPCTSQDECTRDERCNTREGVCEPLERCVGDRTCDETEVCSDGRCRESVECEASSDCDDDLECIGQRCVPRICRGDGDCSADERCRAGDCVTPEAPTVTTVRIITPPRTIRVGQEVAFQAIALNEAGDIVANEGFRWSSTNSDIVAIDEDTGRATGGPSTGTGNIAATFINPDRSAVTSDPVVPIRVITADVSTTFQVRAVALDTGEPAARVSIVVGDEVVVTNRDGLATFDLEDGPVTVTAFSNTYNTLTIVGAPATEIILPLERRRPMGDIAGFTGEVDFSNVRTEGGVELSLTGASFGEGLDRLSFNRLIGDIFSRNIGLGSFSFDLPLPGGVTLRAELPFIG
ncbi:MAG: Ig-like domain-containing protein, partial [Myxococcota bacterium]|nr:Ig-like domain-containing protein [Myxococcota bacterium]